MLFKKRTSTFLSLKRDGEWWKENGLSAWFLS
jgi:hypothetical protein